MVDFPNHKRYRAPAVQKALEFLEIIAHSREEVTLSDLARRGGCSKGSVHGIARVLLERGVLVQLQGQRGFHLGPAIFDLAFSHWNVFQLRDLAEPYLAALRDRTGETVFLGLQSASRVVIVASAESPNTLKISSPAGTSIPLMAGAVGKALLASRSEEEVVQLIHKQGLRKFTSRSITETSGYLAELEKVRNAGYATDDEEYLPGVRAVAVALENRRGLPLLLWLVGFSGALSGERLPLVIEAVREGAAELRHLLDGGEEIFAPAIGNPSPGEPQSPRKSRIGFS